jgi:hypothetical protein
MTQFHTEAFLTPEARIAAASLPKSQRQTDDQEPALQVP